MIIFFSVFSVYSSEAGGKKFRPFNHSPFKSKSSNDFSYFSGGVFQIGCRG